MLPDIAQHNTRFSVSGLGATEGTGVLSRSMTDLHPEEFHYEVVWNGAIEAQIQKANQCLPPREAMQSRAERTQPLGDLVVEAIRKAGKPVSVLEMVRLTGLHYGVVDVTLRRLALRGELSVSDELRDRNAFRRRMVRVYSLPKMAKEQAA